VLFAVLQTRKTNCWRQAVFLSTGCSIYMHRRPSAAALSLPGVKQLLTASCCTGCCELRLRNTACYQPLFRRVGIHWLTKAVTRLLHLLLHVTSICVSLSLAQQIGLSAITVVRLACCTDSALLFVHGTQLHCLSTAAICRHATRRQLNLRSHWDTTAKQRVYKTHV
jgi:hypothetical protein